ncbi:MAG: sugar ABC transporter ATP-binding protein [Planctomycetes bacterium]|nr:sugar ABC transporter ATP-binding protein [Planctomycetota bacterium]
MLRFEHITKTFPGVTALADVSFEIARGECHALLGENGAGKSTLGKIVAGMYTPERGQLLIAGTACHFRSPRQAALAGVAIVHQELMFCPNLSIAENLCLHDLPQRGIFLDRTVLRQRANALLEQVGLDVDVDRPLSSLSIAQEQLVQIAAAVGQKAQILVFDEPTSSLGQTEVERLFQLIRRLQQTGVTIIYVSHRLAEIFELCQRVTVLRDGRHVATRSLEGLSHDELVQMMVGRPVVATRTEPKRAVSSTPPPPPQIAVRGLQSPGRFENIALEVNAGEIVGLAGLVGAGRTEVLEALFGLDPAATGEISLNGNPTRIPSPQAAREVGMTLIPEDRKRQGLVLGMNVRENATLPVLDRFRRWAGLVDRRAEAKLAEKFRTDLAIRTPSTETPVASLSGGNQQKVVFARALADNAQILLIDEPTRGVDVGAKQEIHDLIEARARAGTAVVLVSSDLPELLALSHRLIVLREGRIVAQFTHAEATPDRVLRAMAGIAAVPQ